MNSLYLDHIIQLIGFISAFTVVLTGLFLYIIKKIVKFLLDKDIEGYKNKLQLENLNQRHELDKNIEYHKNELEKDSYRNNRLHDTRLQVVEKLYESISILELNLKQLLKGIKVSTGNNETDTNNDLDEIKNASNSYNDFLKYYNIKKIYLTENICIKLDMLCDEAFNCLWEYNTKYTFGKHDPEYVYQNYKTAAERVKSNIPKIKKDLEIYFRDILEKDNLK